MAKSFRELQIEAAMEAKRNASSSAAKPQDSSSGLLNHLARVLHVVSWIFRPAVWVASLLAHYLRPFARGLYNIAASKIDADGKRHFSPKRIACLIVIGAVIAFAAPFIAMGVYYYGTWRTIKDVYIPDAAVFMNQQFNKANEPGKHVTPRDEIFTVMGRRAHPDGTYEPVRFDIDTNWYFFFYSDAMRPDLAAAKLNSQSPYGVRADLEVTGGYFMLPRFIRVEAARFINLRTEIVRVIPGSVKELTSMPVFVKTVNTPDATPAPKKPAP